MRLPMNEIVIPYHPRYPQNVIHSQMDSHRFSVIVAHRRLGKTVCAVNHMIKKALTVTVPNARYAYMAPQLKQAKRNTWDYFKRFVQPVPNVKISESELTISLPNDSRIMLLGADNPDAIRGMYLDGVVMDEVAQMKPEVWGEIVRPTLVDRQGWAVFIGTPKGMNLFYELYEYAQTLDDWYSALYRVDETDIITESELEMAKATMSDAAYRQEFLCDFSASSDDTLITIDLVSAACKKTIAPADVRGAPKILGVDVARFGDDRSVIVLRQGLWCHEPIVFTDIDNMTLAQRIAAQYDHHEPDALFIDAGRGEGVIDRLRQLGYPAIEVNFGGKPADPVRYANKRSEMWDKCREWIEAGGALPNMPDLKTDLVSPTYKMDASDRMVLEAKDDIKKRGGRSPDIADALVLTFAAPVRPKLKVTDGSNTAKNRFSNADKYDPLKAR